MRAAEEKDRNERTGHFGKQKRQPGARRAEAADPADAGDEKEAQNEVDDTKYMALVQKFETALKSCIDPFEKAFNMTKDESIKSSIAEYLKNTFYRFREEDPKYQAGYEKYSKLLEQ